MSQYTVRCRNYQQGETCGCAEFLLDFFRLNFNPTTVDDGVFSAKNAEAAVRSYFSNVVRDKIGNSQVRSRERERLPPRSGVYQSERSGPLTWRSAMWESVSVMPYEA